MNLTTGASIRRFVYGTQSATHSGGQSSTSRKNNVIFQPPDHCTPPFHTSVRCSCTSGCFTTCFCSHEMSVSSSGVPFASTARSSVPAFVPSLEAAMFSRRAQICSLYLSRTSRIE